MHHFIAKMASKFFWELVLWLITSKHNFWNKIDTFEKLYHRIIVIIIISIYVIKSFMFILSIKIISNKFNQTIINENIKYLL